MSNIRVRIAPSPTGSLHIGTARAALFNYLFAKKYGGKFILRIEDTDLERSDKKYEKDIFDGLEWLGIEADESPEKGGPYGPYRQSERTETYKKYIKNLLEDGLAFYCFHTEEELESEKENLIQAGRPQFHFCEFRTMKASEAEDLKVAKKNSIIRFKTPAGRAVKFNDLIRGELNFESDLLGDFSIAKVLYEPLKHSTTMRSNVRATQEIKSLGFSPLYNFAVVVDDHEMKISHVIRGEDHISNTPKQIFLIEALGLARPIYAHLPLILGKDRSKLSKRHGATSISQYKEGGYLPEALFNFISLLGWNPGGDQEILSKKEVIKKFTIDKVRKSGAIFDVDKLDWMNGEYIRKKSPMELVKLCKSYLKNFLQFQNLPPRQIPGLRPSEAKIFASDPISQFSNEYIEKVVALEQPRLKKLSEIGERVEYFFRMPKYEASLLQWKSMSNEEIATSLEHSEKIISNFPVFAKAPADKQSPITTQKIEGVFLKELGDNDKGVLLWPLRVALTGKKASPSPFEIIEILGKEESLKRIKAAKNLL